MSRWWACCWWSCLRLTGAPRRRSTKCSATSTEPWPCVPFAVWPSPPLAPCAPRRGAPRHPQITPLLPESNKRTICYYILLSFNCYDWCVLDYLFRLGCLKLLHIWWPSKEDLTLGRSPLNTYSWPVSSIDLIVISSSNKQVSINQMALNIYSMVINVMAFDRPQLSLFMFSSVLHCHFIILRLNEIAIEYSFCIFYRSSLFGNLQNLITLMVPQNTQIFSHVSI